MKKKNLVVLLVLPFLISIIGVVTVNATLKTIEKDILGIEWSYSDFEAFKLTEKHPLVARSVVEKGSFLAPGNELVWEVENKSLEEVDPCAEIEKVGNTYFLKPISEGEVYITCANEKGSVSRRMQAIIYEKGAIILQTKVGGSQQNIDNTLYFGEYDLTNGQKTLANVDLTLKCVPETLSDTLVIEEQSPNVNFSIGEEKLSILSEGESFVTLSATLGALTISYTYNFTVVNDGVNVYTYDDLLDCTNRSKEGEIVVLRKSFESMDNAYVKSGDKYLVSNGELKRKANNVECFGNYDITKREIDFSSDIYQRRTTYSTKFIEQWNEFAATNSAYRGISDQINVGIRVQKDFYGNGYTLNLHNLTFPYEETPIVVDGKTVYVPTLSSKNLFRGPLPFYSLGDPNSLPLVSIYGQDNVGMYIDGDNITVNDVNLRNCDFGNSYSNLKYTGTVLEIAGQNVTVKNSQISNGKNVVRAFSANNAKIENCMLSYAQNFLLFLGSNEIASVADSTTFDFLTLDETTQTISLSKCLETGAIGDDVLNQFLLQQPDVNKMKASLASLQKALSTIESVQEPVNVSVSNTLFYRSGVASIALDTAFNGPFLYAKSPSTIEQLFSMMPDEVRNLIPYFAANVSGVSRPVHLSISGNTKFYDYKTSDEMDLSGLIEENISSVFSQAGDFISMPRKITVDDIFPLKKILFKYAETNGQIYSTNGKKYVNVPIAFYGGGINRSTVTSTVADISNYASEPLSLDWITEYLKNPVATSTDSTNLTLIKNMVQRMVAIVTGFENFKFNCMLGNGYLYNQAPNVSMLRDNLKG